MNERLVLNTRAREQATELSTLLRAAGFAVAEAPAIAVVSDWDPAELQRVRHGLNSGAFDWIVLASPNAGRELMDQLKPGQAHVVCGTSTARALGLDAVALTLRRFSAAAALEVLRPRVQTGARVLVPRAAEGRDELIEGLVAYGVSVDAPVVYRTVAVADAARRLSAGDVNVVTLCSPSAVHSVAPSIPRDVVVVCLGATTAAAASNAGLDVAAVARHTSMASLVEAVTEALGARI